MAVTLFKNFVLHPVHNDPEFRSLLNAPIDEWARAQRTANNYDTLGDMKYSK